MKFKLYYSLLIEIFFPIVLLHLQQLYGADITKTDMSERPGGGGTSPNVR